MSCVFEYEKFILSEADKNNDYVNKVSINLTEEEIRKELINNCKQYDFSNENQIIYRGISSNENYIKVNPTLAERRSMGIGTRNKNYYTYIIDNTIIWKNFPKRSNSIIGIRNKNSALMYGTLYRIIPYDNAILGVCPTSDLINSFKYLNDVSFDAINFNDVLANFYNDIFKEDIDSSNYETFKKSLSIFDDKSKIEFIKKKIEKINAFFMKDLYTKFIYQNKKNLSFLDFLGDIIFNPIQNNFKIIKWSSNIKVPKDKEVWTESQALLIKETEIEKFKNN